MPKLNSHKRVGNNTKAKNAPNKGRKKKENSKDVFDAGEVSRYRGKPVFAFKLLFQ